MAVPRKKVTSSRRNMRRAHDALTMPMYGECRNCGENVLPHHICPACGYYNGRQVILQSSEDEET